MSLASAGGGGGGEDLRHSGGPWTGAAGVAEALHTSTVAAKNRLTTAHEGVAAANDGLASVGVLRSVLTSWEERLSAVKDECGSLAPKLRLVAKAQGEQEAKVKSSFQGMDAASGDEKAR
ncbi:hypothetical protein [Streptomyces sp. NPDC006551]|uniref:hypothetical protein n=1 Tax=Streptomyces sp. NPDC006551 TaxID=3157178 RepID=UPI00339DB856